MQCQSKSLRKISAIQWKPNLLFWCHRGHWTFQQYPKMNEWDSGCGLSLFYLSRIHGRTSVLWSISAVIELRLIRVGKIPSRWSPHAKEPELRAPQYKRVRNVQLSGSETIKKPEGQYEIMSILRRWWRNITRTRQQSQFESSKMHESALS